MTNKNYYQILGVDETANADQIKKAYRKLAKQYHPDVHPGDKASEDRFKEISEAYDVLSDTAKRQQYDQMRKYGFMGSRGNEGFNAQGFDFDLSDLFGGGFRTSRRKGQRTTSSDDFFGFGGLGDLFSQILDRESGFGQRSEPRSRGSDVHVDLEIQFETAALGGKTSFVVRKEEICTSCNGSGAQAGTLPEVCSQCHGTGMLSRSQGQFAVNRPCPRCLGKGRIVTHPCEVCGGRGRVQASKRYSVKIAPGTNDGHILKLKGQGNSGDDGRPSGDLILKLKVAEHKFFKNEGLDIYCEVPIEKKIAKKGTKIRVKTIHGNTVELKIPANSNGGKTFRLREMGIRSEEGVGDQYVKIKVK